MGASDGFLVNSSPAATSAGYQKLRRREIKFFLSSFRPKILGERSSPLPRDWTAATHMLSLLSALFATCPSGGGLFFSQYQEASSGNHKYLQIFNPTSASIDLSSGYFIGMCANGCASSSTFESTYSFPSGATIAAGGTYSICNNGLGSTTGCDVTSGSTIVTCTGDDFRALCSGTTSSYTIVDQVGKTDLSTAHTTLPHCVISLHGSHNAYALLLRVCVLQVSLVRPIREQTGPCVARRQV